MQLRADFAQRRGVAKIMLDTADRTTVGGELQQGYSGCHQLPDPVDCGERHARAGPRAGRRPGCCRRAQHLHAGDTTCAIVPREGRRAPPVPIDRAGRARAEAA